MTRRKVVEDPEERDLTEEEFKLLIDGDMIYPCDECNVYHCVCEGGIDELERYLAEVAE
jgi:hypothetical protein